MTRAPVVTNADRDWAMAQMPTWCQPGSISDAGDELADDGGWLDDVQIRSRDIDPPSWSLFVSEEVEKFEEHYAGQYKPQAEWSSIWRKGWWPKVSPRKRFPKSAPKELHPFFRKGTQEFAIALRLATEDERRMWVRFGVAQFKPDDPRVVKIQSAKNRKHHEDA